MSETPVDLLEPLPGAGDLVFNTPSIELKTRVPVKHLRTERILVLLEEIKELLLILQPVEPKKKKRKLSKSFE
jgi:hypothetical protein